MKALAKNIKIPAFLHEVHGYEATVLDLLLNYIVVVITTVLLFYVGWELSLPAYKWVIYGVVAADLSGGVVSNFMDGTSTYYAESPKKRYVFMALHLVQPFLLFWIFPNEGVSIAVIAFYTLTAMMIVNRVKQHTRQRVCAAALMMVGIALAFALDMAQAALLLMLVMFIIKLVLAFPVRWK